MKYAADCQYMSVIETVTDTDNRFLSRRELVCNFAGLAGRLRRLEAVEMITKEFGLDGKLVIPMRLRTHVGKPLVTGTFYVYEDEALAKKHVDPTIFARLEKTRAAAAEAAKEDGAKDDAADAKADGAGDSSDGAKADAGDAKDGDSKDDAPDGAKAEAAG